MHAAVVLSVEHAFGLWLHAVRVEKHIFLTAATVLELIEILKSLPLRFRDVLQELFGCRVL